MITYPLHSAWRERLTRLYFIGSPVGPRGFGTQEQLDQRICIDSRYNLLDVPSRYLNYRFAVAEWIWMMFGHSDVDTIARFNGVMRQFSDDGVWLTGAYGPHIHGQAKRQIERLRKDPACRQAVIEIPRPQQDTKDEPCTLSLQFLVRDHRLNCIVTMRSSDVWLGIPYDVFTFTQIQNCFAGELGLPRGWLSLRMGSSHLYDRDRDNTKRVLASPEWDTLRSPALPGFPPAWLEDILVQPDVTRIPVDSKDPWWPYAQVLCRTTSDDARDILRSLDGIAF